MADASVRLARAVDAAAVAALQLRTWHEVYAQVLPSEALAELAAPDAEAAVEARWLEAVTSPPSPRHRLLVALEGERLVGFAALGPAEDEDLPADAGELFMLLVEPGSHGRGHGSRLLAATVDHLRGDRSSTAVVWLLAGDSASAAFFESAGWGTDGARRDLDMGRPVPQVRLHTDLS